MKYTKSTLILILFFLLGVSTMVAPSSGNIQTSIETNPSLDVVSDQSIAVLDATYYNHNITKWLTNDGFTVDQIDIIATTPTLGSLQGYPLVVVVTDSTPMDAIKLGDNLADYITSGGRVVVTTFGLSTSWGPTGRFADMFLPFTTANNPYSTQNYTGGSTHPIMNGVSFLENIFVESGISITAGSEALAFFDSGVPIVAQRGPVVGINLYPETGASGDTDTLIVNTVNYLLNDLIETPKILMLDATGYDYNSSRWLNEFGYSTSLYYISTSKPTLAELLPYPLVYVITDGSPADPILLGDTLADYIDLGGRVVVTNFGFYGTVGPLGRFSTDYSPFNQGTNPYAPQNYTGGSLHPVMQNVNWLDAYFVDDTITLATGATLIASYSSGVLLAAEKGSVLGINLYPEVSISGDIDILIVNAANYMLGGLPLNYGPTVVQTNPDKTLELGFTGFDLNWIFRDFDPDYYSIYLNGVFIYSNTWFSDTAVLYYVSDYTVGIYNFTIIAFDTFGVSVSDITILTVRDTTAPTLDVDTSRRTYEEGDTGNYIDFTPYDLDPDTFSIFLDGSKANSDVWASGETVRFFIDGLSAGVHTFTIYVLDGSGNQGGAEIIVEVTGDSNTSTSTSSSSPNETSTSTSSSDTTGVTTTTTSSSEPNGEESSVTPSIDLPAPSTLIVSISLFSIAAISRRRKINL